MEPATDFRYVDLKDVDPNFTLLDPEVYNLRITKVEIKTYEIKAGSAAVTSGRANPGDEGQFINFNFTVVGHSKFTGRKIFDSLFPSDFTLKCLKRLEEATGIPQNVAMEEWFAKLSSEQPVVKLQVERVPDLIKGLPNPKTAKSDGTPGDVNKIAWKSGVQSGDVS